MKEDLKLVPISKDIYDDYRNEVIFSAYKWDPQVEDHNTLSPYVLMISEEMAEQIKGFAEALAEETMLMEEALLNMPKSYIKKLGFDGKMCRVLERMMGYERDKNIRLMRFDFHPTETGWAISEVNSDVPGGLAEASILPRIVEKYIDGGEAGVDFSTIFTEAVQSKIAPKGRIALVHATSYSDDRQVMQFLNDYLNQREFQCVFMAPDHIRWKNGRAFSILEGNKGEIDGIVRFFPLEWLENLPRKSGWKGYFETSVTSCNHPVSIFTQSKRLPLVWDDLKVDIPIWKRLLPETKDPKMVDLIRCQEDGWVFKPAFGRVGEGISIREAVTEKELRRIRKSVKKKPNEWIAQRVFKSQPLTVVDEKNREEYHLCIGAFTVDTKFAGFYGRISPYPRIDSRAKDIPVLIMR